MKHFRVILIVGVIEIVIGALALFTSIFGLLFATNNKPLGVLCFVLITGCISALIGIGILTFNRTAYRLLLYFSEFIILSKILILLGVFELNVGLQSIVPYQVSSIISIIYHGYVIYYLKRRKIRQIFHFG